MPDIIEPFDFSQFSEIYRTYPTGIYGVVNPVRQRAYVGATKRHFRQRWLGHRVSLESGTHPSPLLQRDWQLDGGQAFAFVILQELPASHEMRAYEQFWIDSLLGRHLVCYNIAPAHELLIERAPSQALPDAYDLYTVKEISEYLRVHARTVHRWMARQQLPSIQFEHMRLVRRQDLDRFMAERPDLGAA